MSNEIVSHLQHPQRFVRRVAENGFLRTPKASVTSIRLTPRSQLSWLNRTRFLDPIDDLPVWSVPCFFVARSHRGRGVSDALLGAAVEAARAAGARAVEGYPIDSPSREPPATVLRDLPTVNVPSLCAQRASSSR